MKTILAVSLALTASAVTSAQCLEVDEVFSLNSNVDAQTWACASLEDLRGVLARSKSYSPSTRPQVQVPAHCGTAANRQNYKVVKKSDDAACIGYPDNKDGKCSWAVVAPHDVAPAAMAKPTPPIIVDPDPKGNELQLQFQRWEYRGGYARLAVSLRNNTMKPFARVVWACELYDKQQRLVGETYLVFNVVPYSAISAAHNQMVTTTDQFEDGACRLVEAVPVTQRNERLYTSASGTLIIGKYRADATQYFDINYRIQGRAKVVTDEENNELEKLEKAGELINYPGYKQECTPLMSCRFGVSNPAAGQHWLNKLGQ
jgi:hypothetical protein